MIVAYYCPLKPPDHPVPSGDRRVARLLRRALQYAGYKVRLVSRFRSFDGKGDAAKQAALAGKGAAHAERVAAELANLPPEERPDVWLTYHLYHKAPDYLGPAISRALGIPYVIVEPSHAPKQAHGPWAIGYRAAREALRAADSVLTLNPDDEECIRPELKPGAALDYLPPFLEQGAYLKARENRAALRRDAAGRTGADPERLWLLTAAMMRPGDKLESYRVLADALTLAKPEGAELLIAGDGPAARDVRAAFANAPLPVRWLGQADPAHLTELYAAADLFLWPAIREAFGMAILEAQAAGLPVVAGETPGVASVVTDGETGLVAPARNAEAFGAALLRLMDPALRERMGRAAVDKVAGKHDIGCAARRLVQTLRAVTGADAGAGAAKTG